MGKIFLLTNTTRIITSALILPLLTAQPFLKQSAAPLILTDFCFPFQECLALLCIKGSSSYFTIFFPFAFTTHNKRLCRRDRGYGPRGSIPMPTDHCAREFQPCSACSLVLLWQTQLFGACSSAVCITESLAGNTSLTARS